MPSAVIITDTSVTISFPGMTKTVPASDGERFNKLLDLIKANASDEEIKTLLDIGSIIKKHKSGLFNVTADGICQIDGVNAPASLSQRIVRFAREGLPFEPLIKFFKNCLANPLERARTDLYAFLERNGHPITSDGCFIAYRAVNEDWKDYYTGTMDNSIGKTLKMDRSLVNSDPEIGCSTGLHVSALSYASGFVRPNGHLVEVKVNPKNVCSIPKECNCEKIRVCEFEIVSENFNVLLDRSIYDLPNVSIKDENDMDDESNAQVFDTTESDSDTDNEIDALVDTTQNWKNLKRDSKGRFIKK